MLKFLQKYSDSPQGVSANVNLLLTFHRIFRGRDFVAYMKEKPIGKIIRILNAKSYCK